MMSRETAAIPDIKTIESYSFRALPALETRYYDGWIMRFSGGYTRRANSVNPIYGSTLDVDEKIALCEQLYGEKTVFKMTDAACPSGLDDVLAVRGYRKESDVMMKVRSLDDLSVEAPVNEAWEISAHEDLTEQWMKTFAAHGEIQPRFVPVMRHMLSLIPAKRGFFTLTVDERIAALGLGVVDDEFVSMFDIVTVPEFRRKGYGEALVRAILAWGRSHGAKYAFLQVVAENVAAINLYHKLGFITAYHYWYRIKSHDQD